MPTRKVRDIDPQIVCRHPEHNPPGMMVYEPGEYEHECPGCGRIVHFTVWPRYCVSPRPRRIEKDPWDDYREKGYVWRGRRDPRVKVRWSDV